MFGVIKKIFSFAGKRKKLLVKSMIVAFIGAVFSALQVVAMMFSLDYIFKNDSSYLLYILREINQQIRIQIDNGTNQYFDNYCKLVLDNFKFNQFYLTPNDIVIFFQQYDIAPYSSGIPTFFIPR